MILIFSLSLRLNLNNAYPRGVDTYDLYALSKNIQEKGYVVWNIDFPTALGLTSISYPSGGIIFLAEISSLTGMDTTNSIIIWNLLLIISCGLLMFLILKEIFKNNFISILGVLIYLNTRFFIAYSTYFTARNILHLFFLAILFLLLKKLDAKKILLIAALICVSFLTHRATIIIGIFLIAFIISKILHKFYKNTSFQNLIIFIIGASLFLISVYIFGHGHIGTESTRIPFTIGIEYIDSLLSILFSVSMHFGILIILLPLGYLFMIRKKEKNSKDIFIITSVTLSLTFVFETIYFFYIFLPIMVILIAYLFERLFSTNNILIRKVSTAIVIVALIAPLYITILE